MCDIMYVSPSEMDIYVRYMSPDERLQLLLCFAINKQYMVENSRMVNLVYQREIAENRVLSMIDSAIKASMK